MLLAVFMTLVTSKRALCNQRIWVPEPTESQQILHVVFADFDAMHPKPSLLSMPCGLDVGPASDPDMCDHDPDLDLQKLDLQLEEAVGKLGEQDEVELEVTLNRRTGARRARAIRLADRAGARRELGQARAFALELPQLDATRAYSADRPHTGAKRSASLVKFMQ